MSDKYIEFTVGQRVYDTVREEYGVVDRISEPNVVTVNFNGLYRCYRDGYLAGVEKWDYLPQHLVPVGTEISLSIPVTKVGLIDFWINIYENGTHSWHIYETQEDAKKHVMSGCIGQEHIQKTYTVPVKILKRFTV